MDATDEEVRDRARGWRVGHRGRDQMYYEELVAGRWERLEVDGEMLTGRAHHVIYFASPGRWAGYPAWARSRREEIVARIKMEFHPPDYEHYEESGTAASPPSPPPSPVAPGRRRPPCPAQGRGALLLVVVLLLGLAVMMGWMVARGIATAETWLPLKQASFRRMVTRAEEPATWGLAMGIYSALGAGALVLGLLGVRELRRLRG